MKIDRAYRDMITDRAYRDMIIDRAWNKRRVGITTGTKYGLGDVI